MILYILIVYLDRSHEEKKILVQMAKGNELNGS